MANWRDQRKAGSNQNHRSNERWFCDFGESVTFGEPNRDGTQLIPCPVRLS